MKQVDIYCKNTGSYHHYPLGTSLLQISKDLNIQSENTICGAIVNHQVKELSFCVVKSKQIEFIDVSHPDGIRMYIRSLIFVLYAAVKEVFPHVSLRIQHGISNGYFCELSGLEREISDSDIFSITDEMQKIVQSNVPFIKREYLTGQVVEKLMKQGLEDKAELFDQQGNLFSSLYFLEDLGNYFYGNLLPSTAYISNFGLIKYFDGLFLVNSE